MTIRCPELGREFPVWLTPAEYAAFRCMAIQAVYRLLRTGRVPGVVKEGTRYRISAAATLAAAGLTVQRRPAA